MFRLASAALAVAAFAALATPAFADYIELNIPNRKDFVFDQAGVLYVTSGSDIVRYDTSSQSYLSSFAVGGSLIGIDLAPSGGTLAVADSTTQGSNNRISLVDTGTGAVTPVSFARAFGEGGTFMVSWGGDGRVLTTSYFEGSGWVPLRRYDPATDTTTVLGSVRQNSMLAASGDGGTIGIAEYNISSGPVHAYDVASGQIVANRDTGWFTFEVAVDPTGQTFVVPTYNGAYVLARNGSSFDVVTTLGQYASYGPIGAAFSPGGDRLYTSEWDYSGSRAGVKVYDTTTWQQIASLDDYNFGWVGNTALVRGRTKISPDGSWLAVSVDGGVRLYDLTGGGNGLTASPEVTANPEPSSLVLLGLGGLGWVGYGWRHRRRAA